MGWADCGQFMEALEYRLGKYMYLIFKKDSNSIGIMLNCVSI